MSRIRLLALIVLTTLIAAACSGDFDAMSTATEAASDSSFAVTSSRSYDESGDAASEDSYDYESEAYDSDGADEAMAEPGEVSVTGSAGNQPVQQLPDLGRDIIFTAWLDLGTTDVSAATRDAIRTVEGLGGFLFSQETQGGSGGSSVLVFKILPEYFQTAMNDLGSIGSVRAQSISADDVTAVVVDLESRISTAEASVTRLRKFLDEATDIEIIAKLENQLLQRETSLEQYRGQLRSVRNQVDLATINLTVTELLNRPALAVSMTSHPIHDAGFSCYEPSVQPTAEPGDPATICYRLDNVGDTPLVNLTVEDPVLNSSIGDLIVVEGSITQLDPGETLILAHEVELTESVRLRTSVSATALDTEGNPLADEVTATAPRLRLDVVEVDDGLPSFGDVLASSWKTLVTIAVLIAIAAVAVAPFALVALVLAPLAVFLFRRFRSSARSAEPGTETEVETDDDGTAHDEGDASDVGRTATVGF